MKIQLPRLSDYKDTYLTEQVNFPLSTIVVPDGGQLNRLPQPNTQLTGWPWNVQVNPKIYDKNLAWPKLTIVTPSYNQEKYIEQTIRAVLLQNYPNLEYIVIDGGSTDETRSIIEKYAPWISFWEMKKDNGQGHAINKGFSLASGTYYSWINSDDYYLENTFHKVISTFMATQAEFVYGYSQNFDSQKNEITLTRTLPLIDALIRMPTLQQPSTFWSSKIHQPIWEELMCSLDYELWLRMLPGKKKKLIKAPLAVANVHQEAKTHNPEMGKNWAIDHELICCTDAHGPVTHWKMRYLLHRIWIKINKYI
ncbi:glycosyltransferase family 2 protein [Pedobacter frigidisoli]|uniref:glycosyltransferase family 2 protein n=1 Tax=Pedobacter frigidisoli TaxID=2530455 RepID=UPI002930AE6E|nr:glycosyltransferase family 2 protein [Pedobacter frigidisoli]